MKELKKKHSVWLSESAWADVEHHYQADNCSTKNEYIEKAIQFYSGYLDTEHAEEYLPRVLSDVLEGKLGAFGKRMGHPALQAGGGPGSDGESACQRHQCRPGYSAKTSGALREKCERDQRGN